MCSVPLIPFHPRRTFTYIDFGFELIYFFLYPFHSADDADVIAELLLRISASVDDTDVQIRQFNAQRIRNLSIHVTTPRSPIRLLPKHSTQRPLSAPSRPISIVSRPRCAIGWSACRRTTYRSDTEGVFAYVPRPPSRRQLHPVGGGAVGRSSESPPPRSRARSKKRRVRQPAGFARETAARSSGSVGRRTCVVRRSMRNSRSRAPAAQRHVIAGAEKKTTRAARTSTKLSMVPTSSTSTGGI